MNSASKPYFNPKAIAAVKEYNQRIGAEDIRIAEFRKERKVSSVDWNRAWVYVEGLSKDWVNY